MEPGHTAVLTLWQILLGILEQVYRFLTHPDVGSIASVAGAVISFYVLLTVSDIRRRVLLKLRAPDTIKDLSDRATTISNLMNDFEASLPTIETQIALARETLRNLAAKVSGDPKRTVRHAIKKIDDFRSSGEVEKNRESVREIYVQILVSVKAIENIIADVREEP